jgi:lipopolysaccharide export system protein LptC
MKLASTRVFPLVLMLALALLSFWLERTAREAPVLSTPNRHDPDYSAERFTIIDYGRDGTPVSTLSAVKMEHYPDDDSTVLAAPRLVQTRPGEPRFDLSAERGTLSRDGEEVFLNDNVVLVREPGEGLPETRMRTSYLHVVPSRALARTDREVRVEERGRTLVGRGMEYDNRARQLLLQSQVRGSFEVKQ